MEAAFPLTSTMTTVMEAAGVLTIGVGALVSLVIAARQALLSARWGVAYDVFRASFGRGILLGLEFLVAADIIRTVAVKPTLQNVAVLALIILIRTALSVSLKAEIEGTWPWQQPRHGGVVSPPADDPADPTTGVETDQDPSSARRFRAEMSNRSR